MFSSLTSTSSALLGGEVEFHFEGRGPALPHAEEKALAEAHRLERVFNVYDDDSELSRWARGEVDAPSSELADVLWAAEGWYLASDGAFHPACGVLRDAWERAEEAQRMPAAASLTGLAEGLSLPFHAGRRHGDCTGVDLNGIARGYVIDKVLAAAWSSGLAAAWIDTGGELVHRGTGHACVDLTDPLSSNDRAPVLTRVPVANAGIATSGHRRRGYFVGGRWHGSILDPRTGSPARDCAAATVIARDALTADALATIATVLPPVQALAFLEKHRARGYLVTNEGRIHASAGWPR